MTVHGTRRFRDRIPDAASANVGDESSTWLGHWYANLLRWRSPVALFVNETTLLPVLVPLAPARSLIGRLPTVVAGVLAAHHVPATLIDRERVEVADCRLAPTANRQLVGVMNEFAFLADTHRTDGLGIEDLLELSLRLATTPCGPLYDHHVSPDRELTALVNQHAP